MGVGLVEEGVADGGGAGRGVWLVQPWRWIRIAWDIQIWRLGTITLAFTASTRRDTHVYLCGIIYNYSL